MYVGSASRLLSSSSKFMKKKKKTATQAFRVVASMHCSWLGSLLWIFSHRKLCAACIASSTRSHASANTQYLMYCLHHKLHTLAAGSFWKRRRQQNVEALPKLCAVPIHSLATTVTYIYSYIHTGQILTEVVPSPVVQEMKKSIWYLIACCIYIYIWSI